MSVLVETTDGVTTLRLNRPEKRNAFTREMVAQLHSEIHRSITDPTSRCLVIAGEGEHFCAGRDLQSFSGSLPYAELVATDGEWANVFRMLDQADLPSVAIVRGCAFAGGFTLAMGCDFVLADASARFQVSEMRHNFPAAINTPVLSKLLGPRQALELAILGETISAQRLYDMGLINRLSDSGSALAEEAVTFIDTIAGRDKIAVAQTKQLHRTTRQAGLSDALNMGALVNTQVALEGKFVAASKSLGE
ncbi:MAG: enoyl-CoA hydratase/isomerase family protein [Pseudomonadales bacterium]|nr:enoyl-CoA hydratase/isomerase family protein [Pseudomonadales bacterium]